jgi:hypothetical protein
MLNQNLVKISMSKIPIDSTLELGQEVKLFVEGSITKISQEDNQDGSFDQVYIVKGIMSEVIPN